MVWFFAALFFIGMKWTRGPSRFTMGLLGTMLAITGLVMGGDTTGPTQAKTTAADKAAGQAQGEAPSIDALWANSDWAGIIRFYGTKAGELDDAGQRAVYAAYVNEGTALLSAGKPKEAMNVLTAAKAMDVNTGEATALHQRAEREVLRVGAQLEVLPGKSWTVAYNYATYEGLVRNLTNQPLRYVRAVVTYTTEDGTFVTSDASYIQYTTLMPGQTSPFKLLTRHNPAMQRARVEFQEGSGGARLAHFETAN